MPATAARSMQPSPLFSARAAGFSSVAAPYSPSRAVQLALFAGGAIGLPAIYAGRQITEAGGLMSYGADRFPVLAAELVNLKADLIMTRGTPAALAARRATRTIPVVMAAIRHGGQTGVVASIAHPGGNITGLSSFIRMSCPSANRITPSVGWSGMGEKKQPVRCVSKPISSTCGVPRISARRSNWRYTQRADALIVGIDDIVQANMPSVIGLTAQTSTACHILIARVC